MTEKSVLRLTERNIDEKLEILFRKNCYSIAIQLAENSRCPPQKIMGIFKRYGDHLYEKCDYGKAIEQYCATIGTKISIYLYIYIYSPYSDKKKVEITKSC